MLLVIAFAVSCALAAHSRQAYVISCASSDLSAAPGYVYGGLALVHSIRAVDSHRDIIVLVDGPTLAAYPTVRGMFAANNATVMRTETIEATRVLHPATTLNWIASFNKMGIFQMTLLPYDKLLYLDSDGIVLASPDRIFALDLTDGVEAYAMRDVHGCGIADDTPEMMGCCVMFGNGGQAQISLANRLTNFLIDAVAQKNVVRDDQRVIAELLGGGLRLLNESEATTVFRCGCRQNRRGVARLDKVVYAHFMSVAIDLAQAAYAVLTNTTYSWHKTTVHNSIEPDCYGVAYRAWLKHLRGALGQYRGDPVLRQRLCDSSLPEVDRYPCRSRAYSSKTALHNVGHIADGNVTTFAASLHSLYPDTYFQVTVPLDAPPVRSVEVLSGSTAYSNTDRLLPGEFDILVDGVAVTTTGLVYRSARSVMVVIRKIANRNVAIREIAIEYMPAPTVAFVERIGAVNNTVVEFRALNRTLARDPWHDSDRAVDGDLRTALDIDVATAGRGLRFAYATPLLACGVQLCSGATQFAKDAVFSGDVVYINDDFTKPFKTLSGICVNATASSTLFISSVTLAFSDTRKARLKIRELALLPPTSHTETACKAYG